MLVVAFSSTVFWVAPGLPDVTFDDIILSLFQFLNIVHFGHSLSHHLFRSPAFVLAWAMKHSQKSLAAAWAELTSLVDESDLKIREDLRCHLEEWDKKLNGRSALRHLIRSP